MGTISCLPVFPLSRSFTLLHWALITFNVPRIPICRSIGRVIWNWHSILATKESQFQYNRHTPREGICAFQVHTQYQIPVIPQSMIPFPASPSLLQVPMPNNHRVPEIYILAIYKIFSSSTLSSSTWSTILCTSGQKNNNVSQAPDER